MRFLADESCDFAVVRALRSKGFDVLAISEVCPGVEDQQVIELAKEEERILLTEDKDFGRFAYFSGASEAGVVLLRFPARSRQELCTSILSLINREGSKLERSFVILQPGRVRIRRERDFEKKLL
ncbi:MAG: DUF5615 family PIN-like protein [Atribacterales bacterium]